MSKKKVRSKKSFSLYQFHPSPAAGLEGGQFNRKRDSGLAKFIKKANIEYRIMNTRLPCILRWGSGTIKLRSYIFVIYSVEFHYYAILN